MSGKKQKNLDKAAAVIAMAEREYDDNPIRPRKGSERMAYESNGGKVEHRKGLRERLQDGELQWLKNVPYPYSPEDGKYIDGLREQFGRDGVNIDAAMMIPKGHSTGLPKGTRNQSGVYVDAAKYAELHPDTQK